MKRVQEGLDSDGSLTAKHASWQKRALEEGQILKKSLLEEEFAINFACDNLNMSGKDVEKECKFKMTRSAIDMARKRKIEKEGDYTLESIIASKKHHLLHNDDQNVLIFGDDKAVQRLAVTNTIHADGTFSCIIPGFFAALHFPHNREK